MIYAWTKNNLEARIYVVLSFKTWLNYPDMVNNDRRIFIT